MKALFTEGMAIVMILVWGSAASAQTAHQPGQIATVSHLTVLTPAIAAGSGTPELAGKVELSTTEERHDRIANRIWIASMFAMVAASGFDAGTSWGKQEANGLLASPDGTFGARGLSIKAGVAAAIIMPQILLRKHKDLRTKFSVANFAGAGVFTGVGIHNLGIAGPR